MKPILALLFSVTLFSSAFAQNDATREEAKRIILGERRDAPSYPNNDDRNISFGGDGRTVYGATRQRYPVSYPNIYSSSRERRAYEIDRAYDEKIYSIRHNRTLSKTERERIIRQLEMERRRKLEQLNGYYYGNDRRYNDDCNEYKKYKNKGNYYSWRGNPHWRN